LTGPAEGKLKIEASVILLKGNSRSKLENVDVYVHLKGYALARVTHLDIEHEALNSLIPPKGGKFLIVIGVDGGLEIRFNNIRLLVLNPLLNRILEPGFKTRTWVGGKFGGIYIGFRKNEVSKLERLAETLASNLQVHFEAGEA
jgi:hypothetical protein